MSIISQMNITVDVRRSTPEARSTTGAISKDWQSQGNVKCRKRPLSLQEMVKQGMETDQQMWKFIFKPGSDIRIEDELWIRNGTNEDGTAIYDKYRVNNVKPQVAANKLHHYEVDATLVK